MGRKRKQQVLVLALFVLLLLCNLCVCAAGNSGMSVALERNETATRELYRDELGTAYASASQPNCYTATVTASILNATADKSGVTLSVYKNGVLQYSVDMVGDKTALSAQTGFAGAYAGFFKGNIQTENAEIPVCLDIYYADSDNAVMFVTVSKADYLGMPAVSIFGTFSAKTASVSEAYKNKLASTPDTSISRENTAVRSDTTIYYRGTSYIRNGSYRLGTISIYSTQEVGSNQLTTVLAKASMDQDEVYDYMENELTMDITRVISSSITVNEAIIGIQSHSSSFHTEVTDCVPAAGISSYTQNFPVYIPVIGFLDIPITSVASSVSISTQTQGTAVGPTTVTWTLKKTDGWDVDDINCEDGSYESAPGIGCKTRYLYEGVVNSSTEVQVRAKGTLNFVYDYYQGNGNGTYPVHFDGGTGTTSYYDITVYSAY